MSITFSRTFSNVTDSGLLFSNIQALEVRTTATDSMLDEPGLLPNPFVGPFAGLNWAGFVAGVNDKNQSLKVTFDYDITATNAAQAITSIASNTILPDSAIPVGVRYIVVQEIFDADGNLIGRSELDRSAVDNDTQDPPLEAGDFQLTRAYNSVHVRLTVEVISDDTAPDGATASFSRLSQVYNPGLPAGLGDYVWEDVNQDGLQDGTDLPIAGVTVQLLDTNGNQIDETTTNGVGYYEFTNLVAGDYSVRFVTPAGYAPTLSNQGGNDAADSDAVGGVTQEITLTAGQFNGTLDAGFFKPVVIGNAGLGDYVWEDKNRDGIQGDDEQAIAGVTVQLLDTDGNQIDETTTDGTGYYQFIGLVPGDYSVRFLTPSGYTPTLSNQGGDDAEDSDAVGGITQEVTLTSGEFNGTLDAGFFRPAGLGDYVWEDKDRDGIQDDDEQAIAGVTVQLLDGDGNQVGETTTNGVGYYEFVGLNPGDYSVRFLTPSGYTPTLSNQGGDDAEDSDAVGGITQEVTLTSGEFNGTLDAGFFRPAGLGDYVWEDKDRDGIQDDDEQAIAGVTVQLLDGDGNQVGETTTNGVGYYEFVGLNPGDYSVRFLTPSGYTPTLSNQGGDDAEDSDAVGGVTQEVTLTSGEFNGTLDAGFYKPNRSLDLEKTTDGSSNSNTTDSDYDNEDAADGAGVPILAAGSDVTWTYRVENTGEDAFQASEITLVDDNGTPGDAADDMSIANGEIIRIADEVGDNDDLLEAGEVWLYQATGTVQNLGSVGAPVTIVMEGNSALSGTAGNERSFGAGGVDVKATAFSRDSGGAWSKAFLGAFGGGLGVTDGSEGNGSGNSHTVDNTGRDNYVLFRFDQSVVVDQAYLGYVVNDSDLRLWIGTVDGAFDSSIMLSDAFLAGLGFTEVNETTSSSARWADFNAGNLAGNVLVIAANTGEPTTEDNFKIEKLKVAPGNTGIYENIATVSAPDTPSDSDASHYKNGPPPAPPKPGLDLEKTTDGSTNSNTTDSNYDNEDSAGGIGVPKLVAGSDVTWTYRLENTGETTFTAAEIVLVDDNGTASTSDDMSIANGKIVRIADELGDNDDLLEAGEVWLYQATGVVKNLTTPGSSTTFDFSGNTATDGSDGNVRTYSSGGINVKASAFSEVSGGWATAYLGAYGGGLGVTDRGEGSGSGNAHTVDNVGRENFVVFRFDQSVVVDKAFLGYVVCDSDISVWIGNVDNAYSGSFSLNSSVLNGLTHYEVNNTDSSYERWADFNAGNVAGNILVIAASLADTTPDDYFKIEKLAVAKLGTVGVYENEATVSAQGVTDSDLSHYTNGAPTAPPKASIDLEKSTNGPSNTNTTAPGWDNEDAANGSGVPVLTPGSSVTWSYKLYNDGGTKIAASDIVLVDDNGTTSTSDDMSIANGKITLKEKQGGNQDNVLDPGETWLYEAKGTVKDLATWGSATTFDFSGNSATDGSDGNTRLYTMGDISVKANAFSEVNGGYATAWLGAYGGGLGVTDRGEGSGSGDAHTVDNMGRENFVMFRFNQDVVLDKAYLGYVVCDSDISVWIGHIDNAFTTSISLNASTLSSLGFYEVNDTTSSSARWADVNAGNLAGNVIVIAASLADTTPDDRFKIEKLAVYKTPEIGVYENEATVWVPGASDSDLSHYTNPDIWS
ncbi:SdrD B-like domain-containing protein [Roseomonas sp. AR75]|uniref:SdrD B-like domain-containing protein n=1 Tax=Roseomonas sp. AR75 TaxID=2562311 RepID=UPI0010C014AD|nr:SdrD B-like domain-containing protein [Roseomonas sp. AR75]